MKRCLIIITLCFVVFNVLYAVTPNISHIYLQVGQTTTFTDTGNTWDATNLMNNVYFENSGSKFTITGLVVGTMPFYIAYKSGAYVQRLNIYVIHVVDVQEVAIPGTIAISVGDTYPYLPIIKQKEASITFTWKSSNTSVATINSEGVLTAIGVGNTTITCTASNGVSDQSFVTVSPVYAQKVKLDRHDCEMSIGETVQIESSIIPESTTIKQVKWISSNENVAQVDDTGNVMAVGSGYCSIYAKADDCSGKFDKCLIHVLGTDVKGDVNEDGTVNGTDIQEVINIIVNDGH